LYSRQEITDLPDRDWMRLVGEWAYPDRKHTMQSAVALSYFNGAKMIVETGCIRGWAGDGQSTLILATLAIRLGAAFHSIDLSPQHIENAQKWLGPLADTVVWHTADSIGVLKAWDKGTIDLLYLDSYDYEVANPTPCQQHQLEEAKKTFPHLEHTSIVLMDDANQDNGGKVKLSKGFFLSKGWVAEAEHYQLMMRSREAVGVH